MREDVALKQSGSNSGNGEKRTDSGYSLEVKQAGLTDGLDVENAEKRGIRDDCWIKQTGEARMKSRFKGGKLRVLF